MRGGSTWGIIVGCPHAPSERSPRSGPCCAPTPAPAAASTIRRSIETSRPSAKARERPVIGFLALVRAVSGGQIRCQPGFRTSVKKPANLGDGGQSWRPRRTSRHLESRDMTTAEEIRYADALGHDRTWGRTWGRRSTDLGDEDAASFRRYFSRTSDHRRGSDERDADGREASTSDRSEASVERLAKQAREYQVSDPANLTSRGTERGITNRRLISTLVFIIL